MSFDRILLCWTSLLTIALPIVCNEPKKVMLTKEKQLIISSVVGISNKVSRLNSSLCSFGGRGIMLSRIPVLLEKFPTVFSLLQYLSFCAFVTHVYENVSDGVFRKLLPFPTFYTTKHI